MITIGSTAQDYFRRLVEQQDIPGLGVRLRVEDPGTPQADCKLEFCEPADLDGDEWTIECEGFNVFVESASVPFLDAAHIDYERKPTGGQLTIKAPHIKGKVPDAESSLVERVRYVIDSEINPGVASHGGRVTLLEVSNDGIVTLRFGGGCHGCGMSEVTLKEGIEKTLKARIPEITGVRDATDHSTGHAPYVRRTG